jgi:hypothetical protein
MLERRRFVITHEEEGSAIARTIETADELSPNECTFIRAPYVSGAVIVLLAVDMRAARSTELRNNENESQST